MIFPSVYRCFSKGLLGKSAVLALSSPGFLGSSQPGGGGGGTNNFFVIGRIMMKLGKLVKC